MLKIVKQLLTTISIYFPSKLHQLVNGYLGLEESLYPFIDHPHVVCFNELQEGSGRSCFRPWFERSGEYFYNDSMIAELRITQRAGEHKFHAVIIGFLVFVFLHADARRFVESDADEQLLFFIPFTGNVKLKSIRIVASDPSKRPTKMKVSSLFMCPSCSY